MASNFTPPVQAPLTLQSTTSPQLLVNYDGTHRSTLGVASDGAVKLKVVDQYDYTIELPDNTFYFRFADNGARFNWPNGAFSLQVNNGGSYSANTSRIVLGTNPSSDPGIGDGGAANTLTLLTGGAERVKLTNTAFAIQSGVALQLGNAYVNTPSVSTGYLLVTDSTGTIYEVPAKAH